MITITNTAKAFLLAALVICGQNIFAQEKSEKSDKPTYRVKIVKDNDGKKEVIDRTFASKDEMNTYMKENNIESPEKHEHDMDENIVIEKSCDKHHGKECDKKCKKVIIIEKEEGMLDGNTELNISYSNLSAEERASMIQELLNMENSRVALIQIGKDGKQKLVHTI